MNDLRIVSLVPSLTHLLVDLGLKSQIVGCTKFCIDPPDLHRAVELCGGTKDPDLELIKSLHPTHIIVNDEENKPEHIEALKSVCQVLETFPKSPDDVPELIRSVCSFLQIEDANNLAGAVEEALKDLSQVASNAKVRSFAYFIWKDPWMVVGPDTYISRMLELMGWRNVIPEGDRYPSVTLPLDGERPDLIILSTEPYPFRKRDLEALAQLWPDHPDVLKGDGMLFSWYGSKATEALHEAKKYCRGEPQQLLRSM